MGKKPATLGSNTRLFDWIPQNDLLGETLRGKELCNWTADELSNSLRARALKAFNFLNISPLTSSFKTDMINELVIYWCMLSLVPTRASSVKKLISLGVSVISNHPEWGLPYSEEGLGSAPAGIMASQGTNVFSFRRKYCLLHRLMEFLLSFLSLEF